MTLNKNILRLSLIGLWIPLILSSCTPNRRGDKIMLRLNLPQNVVYRYSLSNTQSTSAQNATMQTQNKLDVDYQAIKETDKTETIKATVKRVIIKVNSPGFSAEFDTQDEAAQHSQQPAIAQMLNLVNKNFFIQINKENSNIQNITTDSSGMNIIAPADSSFLNLLTQSFNFYPKKAIAVGDRWQATIRIPVQGNMTTLKTNYTLQSIHGDTALIKVHGVLTAPDKTVLVHTTEMSFHVDGTQQGELKIFIPEGRLISAHFSNKINSTVAALNKKQKMTMNGELTITSQKENP